MYRFLVWTTAISLAPLTMSGFFSSASKQLGDSPAKPDAVRTQVSVAQASHGAGGLQDRKVLSTGTEVWQGIERRSSARRTPDALHNALYTTSACETDCGRGAEAAVSPHRPRSPDVISF